MAFTGKNSSGIEYSLSALSTKLEYAPGKYYLTWDRQNLFVTGQVYEGTLYENQVEGTIYNTSLFGNDPWVTYTETDYWVVPYADVNAAWQLNLVKSSSFVNFKTKRWAGELTSDASYKIDTYVWLQGQTGAIAYNGFNMTKNNIILMQGPGGNGGVLDAGNVVGNKKFISGGGSGGFLALILNPNFKMTNTSGGLSKVAYYILMSGTATVSGYFTETRGLHLYMCNDQWVTPKVWLATATAGGNGKTKEDAAVEAEAGTTYVNSTYYNKDAMYVLNRYDGVEGSPIDKNYESNYIISATPENKIFSTYNTTYRGADCTYNYYTIGGYTGGNYETTYMGALSYDTVEGGGAPSYFANGADASTSYLNDDPTTYGNATKGAGGGAVYIGTGGNYDSDIAGQGGSAYVEIYHY